MDFDHLTGEDIVAFFQSPRGRLLLRVARGEMTVAEVFSLGQEDTELVRMFLIFWNAANKRPF